MKRIITSAFGLVLFLGFGTGIALPAKDAGAQQAQGQMPMMGLGQKPMMGDGKMGHGGGGQGKMAPGRGAAGCTDKAPLDG